jgi:ribonuclease HI
MTDFMKTALAEGNYIAYTDGSCKPNPGPGGCAYRLYGPDGSAPSEFSRNSKDTTNNIAEMQAVIEALKATPVAAFVTVCLDSDYIKKSFEDYLPKWSANGWKKSNGKPVENREKWEAIKMLSGTRVVTFHKIEAHVDDLDFAHVQQLAREETERAECKIIRMLKAGR